MNSVSTLPRPITDYQPMSLSSCSAALPMPNALGEQVMVPTTINGMKSSSMRTSAAIRCCSKLAAERSERPYVVFCGVHFMAETADILSRSHQTVILPDMAAGCSMADMAAIEQVDQCWETLGRMVPVEETVMPAVYVNSAAVLKAFCGEHGGITCTRRMPKLSSSGAGPAARRFSFPRRTPRPQYRQQDGPPREQMIVWDPFQPNGGNTREAILRAKLILWKGHCSVHQMFPGGPCRLFPQAVSSRQGHCASGMS